jgi:hypothetical protein
MGGEQACDGSGNGGASGACVRVWACERERAESTVV